MNTVPRATIELNEGWLIITARSVAYIGDENALRSRLFLKRKGRAMPRYFFDTQDGELVRDDIGLNCDNFQDMLAQATSGLADFAHDAVPGAKYQEMAVRVRDEQDRPVLQAILRLEITQSKQGAQVRMSDDMDDPQDESPAALRAKAAHYMKLAELMGQETRARLIQKANDFLEQAAKLEEEARTPGDGADP